MHKIIYTGLEAPRDKQTYLWKRKDANGASALYEYRGTKWEKVAGGGGGGGMIETTYDDLVDLRDSGSLSPGTWYRITDYETMTSQENTRSAGHQFDVAVLALSGNELSEEAKALRHVGASIPAVEPVPTPEPEPEPEPNPDSNPGVASVTPKSGVLLAASSSDEDSDLNEDYFCNCNLSAWKLGYCLDNDTSRFPWASVGGKYLLISPAPEYTIKFYRDASKDIVSPAEATKYAWVYTEEGAEMVGYTVSDTNPELITVVVPGEGQMDFPVTACVDSKPGKGVIYHMIDENNNECYYDFKNIQFKFREVEHEVEVEWPSFIDVDALEWLYTFSAIDEDSGDVYDGSVLPLAPDAQDIIPRVFSNNVVKALSSLRSAEFKPNILFGKASQAANISGCANCYIGNDSEDVILISGINITVGNTSVDVFCAEGCSFCTLGDNASEIVLDEYCIYITFGHDCYQIALGAYSMSNTFGSMCGSIYFYKNSSKEANAPGVQDVTTMDGASNLRIVPSSEVSTGINIITSLVIYPGSYLVGAQPCEVAVQTWQVSGLTCPGSYIIAKSSTGQAQCVCVVTNLDI